MRLNKYGNSTDAEVFREKDLLVLCSLDLLGAARRGRSRQKKGARRDTPSARICCTAILGIGKEASWKRRLLRKIFLLSEPFAIGPVQFS